MHKNSRLYVRLSLTDTFKFLTTQITAAEPIFDKNTHIKRIFNYVYMLGIDKAQGLNNRYFYNDLFNKLYDMERDELIQYENDMEFLINTSHVIKNNHDKENTTLEC